VLWRGDIPGRTLGINTRDAGLYQDRLLRFGLEVEDSLEILALELSVIAGSWNLLVIGVEDNAFRLLRDL
jgi:hypothetical protein